MPVSKPTPETVLASLSRERLYDLGRVMGAGLRETKAAKPELVRTLSAVLGPACLPAVLHELGRDELRAVCKAHALEDPSPQRSHLIETLLTASGLDPRASVHPQAPSRDGVPREGQVLAARGRQWMVERVALGEIKDSPLLTLACLDDDAPGKKLELLWDLEIGARVIEPRTQGRDF